MRRKGIVKRIAMDLDFEIKNIQDNNLKKGLRISYTEASRIAADKIGRRDKR